MIRPANRREMLALFPKNGTIAEIGVFRGVYAERIIERCQPERLYLVDLWNETIDWLIDGKLQNVGGEEAYQLVKSKFAQRPEVTLVRRHSAAFLASLPDASLDVIYLDADHSYQSVRDELSLAWHRVRPGGWIAGHDYCDLFPGVVQGVKEFLWRHKLKLDVLTDEEPGPVINCPGGPTSMAYNSFAFRKPQ